MARIAGLDESPLNGMALINPAILAIRARRLRLRFGEPASRVSVTFLPDLLIFL
jgi:hypothetical protein